MILKNKMNGISHFGQFDDGEMTMMVAVTKAYLKSSGC